MQIRTDWQAMHNYQRLDVHTLSDRLSGS